ncbi:MAG: glycosyltransferase [Cytophagaceae bacterium]|nr:glycosyltransferase [Cytophagaceae bacterium]
MTLISRLVFFTEKKTQKKSSGRIKTNEISIVIPVKDNQKGIDNYLDNFFTTHTADNFPKEIIIVDNNSAVPTKISNRHLLHGLTVNLLSCKKPGPASARNYGAHHATGQWLLFNDSDCLPTATLLTGYLHADNFSLAYAGNIKALGQDRLSKYYESQEILIPLKTYNDKKELVPQYLITANTLVWTDSFLEVGGFNENIKIAGGEDVDFGLRLSQLGNLSYAFDSIALHNFDGGLKSFYNRFNRYGQGNRIVEHLWQTNMKPKPFRPNRWTIFNGLTARLQYLFLLIGYLRADRQIKKTVHNRVDGLA